MNDKHINTSIWKNCYSMFWANADDTRYSFNANDYIQVPDN